MLPRFDLQLNGPVMTHAQRGVAVDFDAHAPENGRTVRQPADAKGAHTWKLALPMRQGRSSAQKGYVAVRPSTGEADQTIVSVGASNPSCG